MKTHATIGGELLQALPPAARPDQASCATTTERWDGGRGGYPDGMVGEEDAARDAHRGPVRRRRGDGLRPPYQQGHDGGRDPGRVAALRRGQFDPAVVAAFTRVVAYKGRAFVVNSGMQVIQGPPECAGLSGPWR